MRARSWLLFILRRSRSGERQPSCSPKTRRGGLREYRQAAGAFARVRLIAITIWGPSREIHSAWGLVTGIGSARPADSTYGGFALLPCCEPAIRGAVSAEVVISTPRVVLRLGGFFDADAGRENYNDE